MHMYTCIHDACFHVFLWHMLYFPVSTCSLALSCHGAFQCNVHVYMHDMHMHMHMIDINFNLFSTEYLVLDDEKRPASKFLTCIITQP